jgi:hypothetical protein
VRPREANLMVECVEDGVTCGLQRAFKHSDKPDEHFIIDTITQAVMEQIDAYWSFEDEPK